MKTGDYTQGLQGMEYIALVSVRVCYNPGVSPQDVEDQAGFSFWDFGGSGDQTQDSGLKAQGLRDRDSGTAPAGGREVQSWQSKGIFCFYSNPIRVTGSSECRQPAQ